MTVMEFILVAHAIIVGLAVAEILRGFAGLSRSNSTRISYRLILIAVWTLLLLLQVWWSVRHVSGHNVWTFSEFLVFLLPVGFLYFIARLCFPTELNDTDLDAYYSGVARIIWWLVAATYAAFAFYVAPFVYGGLVPAVFASQVGTAVLALIASRVKSPAFQVIAIIVMLAEVLWRGFSYAIGVEPDAGLLVAWLDARRLPGEVSARRDAGIWGRASLAIRTAAAGTILASW